MPCSGHDPCRLRRRAAVRIRPSTPLQADARAPVAPLCALACRLQARRRTEPRWPAASAALSAMGGGGWGGSGPTPGVGGDEAAALEASAVAMALLGWAGQARVAGVCGVAGGAVQPRRATAHWPVGSNSARTALEHAVQPITDAASPPCVLPFRAEGAEMAEQARRRGALGVGRKALMRASRQPAGLQRGNRAANDGGTARAESLTPHTSESHTHCHSLTLTHCPPPVPTASPLTLARVTVTVTHSHSLTVHRPCGQPHPSNPPHAPSAPRPSTALAPESKPLHVSPLAAATATA
jgi:hypothetical protein